MSPLIECHAHVLPDAVLARFPGGSSPRYVTAERRVLGRMLEARFHTDTNVWSLPALELLLGVLGPDRLLVGNDQPPVWFPLGESLALLERLPLSAADREAVYWRNAAGLFGFVPAA